jgi:hypothetical protein
MEEVALMTLRGTLNRIVAGALLVSLHAALVPAVAAPAASLSGRVLLADGRMPVTSGKVHVGNPRTGAIATADLRGDGTFTVSGLEPATYQVAVETAGVLNVASNAVLLGPGQSKAVQVAVDPVLAQAATPAEEEERKKKVGMSLWNNPLMATAIVVVSAVVVGVAVDGLTDDDEEPASAS